VPLSDHEQKLLEQIEQALYAEDPKFAASVRKVKSRRPRGRRWIALSILGVLVGLGLVLVGLLAKLIILGIIGFVLIVAACAYGAHSLRRGSSASSNVAGAPSAKARDAGGLRGRMEDRLRRRFDEN
jgi:Flp pilus assembly protein TadB